MLSVAVLRGGLVRHRVVDLLVHYRFTLRRVTDDNAGQTTERLLALVAVPSCLLESCIYPPHHLPADHTYFIENEQMRVLKLFLEKVQRFSLTQLLEVRRREPVYKPVDRSGLETQIESGAPSGRTDTDEAPWVDLCGQVCLCKLALQVLQDGLYCARLARTSSSEKNETQRLWLRPVLNAFDACCT